MIDIEVEAAAWTADLPGVEAATRTAAEAALSGTDGLIAILLTGDAAVAELNQQFRGKAGPTNVLSFPAAPMPGEGPVPLGDLVLAYGVCAREAETQGKTLADHLSHLVVHGVLHLLGRDHEDDAEAEAMEDEERRILAGLGVPDPYEVRV